MRITYIYKHIKTKWYIIEFALFIIACYEYHININKTLLLVIMCLNTCVLFQFESIIVT